ncbi:MAG: prolipoprotein diacylglyceryl transferase [Pseudomonadota bacterium]
MIKYPEFDPVAIALGPIKVRWYGLTYILGFLACWLLLRYRALRSDGRWTVQHVEEIIFYGMLGVLLGGRLGYVLFYGTETFLQDPLYLFRIWDGGMSFHGGISGVAVAMYLFGRRAGKSFLEVTDFMVPAVPPGLFFGRMGNFINGELWGGETTLPWGFEVNGVVLHPSQLYEAALEGVLLFIIVWVYSSRPRATGAVSGVMLAGYAVFRMLVEFVRTPDAHLGDDGYLAFGWVTMGQVLSLPMLIIGLWLFLRARQSPEATAAEGGR